MEAPTMGEVFDLIVNLQWELDDATSFMETLSEFEDGEAEKRRLDKVELVSETNEVLKQMTAVYKKADEDGTSDESYRICSECGSVMTSGFCKDGGMEYYCSEDCLHKHYTPEQWEEMYEEAGDSYVWVP